MLLKLADLFFTLAGRWSAVITGEWWITKDGQSEYADQDVGDVGHEIVAANYMIDKELLLDYLKDYWKGQLDSSEIDQQEYEEQIDDLSSYYSDEVNAGHVFFNVFIPEEIGAKVVGSLDKWKDMKSDIRLAFAKYEGAIMVINTSFYAWKVTEDTINNIHNFIFEQIDDEEINKDAEILVEEASTKKRIAIDLDQFLMIKYPAELWRISA